MNFHKVYHPSADKTVNFLVLLPSNGLRIQNNFNGFAMIDVHQNTTLSESFEGDGRVLLVTAVKDKTLKYDRGFSLPGLYTLIKENRPEQQAFSVLSTSSLL